MDSDEDYDDEPSHASSECEDGHDHISVREEDTPDDTGPINHEEDILDEDRPTDFEEDMLDEAAGTTNHEEDVVEDAGTADDESVVEKTRKRGYSRIPNPCIDAGPEDSDAYRHMAETVIHAEQVTRNASGRLTKRRI